MFRFLCGLLLAAALAIPRGASTAEITLRLHHFLPGDSLEQTRVLEPWARRIESQSNGRIRVEIFPAMGLGGTPAELYEQARTGKADLVLTAIAHTPERFPLARAFELPFMAASAETTSQAVSALLEEHAGEASSDVHPIFFHALPPASLHMASRQVRRIEDVQDVKIYAPKPAAAAALEVLGAVPVSMPGSQMRHALARHRVEGGAFLLSQVPSLGIAEVPKRHTIVPGLYTSVFVLAMNGARYAQLPDELKAVIDANSGIEPAGAAGRAWDEAEVAAMRAVEDDGFFVLQYGELERWRAKAEPATGAWVEEVEAQGYDGNTLLGRARSLLASFAGRS